MACVGKMGGGGASSVVTGRWGWQGACGAVSVDGITTDSEQDRRPMEISNDVQHEDCLL